MTEIGPIPDDYPRVTPYLSVEDAAAAIDFYEEVFGATERGERFVQSDGTVGHAEIEIGDALIMLADEWAEGGFYSPKRVGGTPVVLHMYVEDVDTTFEKALAAGARAIRPVEDHFHGDRSGLLEDPFGHRWSVSSQIERVDAEEMARRIEESAKQG
ncbi:MAG TPA: VOC family protein [Acidimicrobiia bacterium]|nr:VOC family protein [Acidimicrobiia bacterium]